MGKSKKENNSLEKFLSGEKGKRFFNFAYSIGAAIVILGALFKILHLPGGNIMLSVGMGVEVIMFCLSAFEHPSMEYKWEDVFPVLSTKKESDRPKFNGGGCGGGYIGNINIPASMQGGDAVVATPVAATSDEATPVTDATPMGGGYVATGGGDTALLTQCIQQLTEAVQKLSGDEPTASSQQQANILENMAEQMEQMAAATRQLTAVSTSLLEAINRPAETPTGAADSTSLVDKLNSNISGLNAVYEMQLRNTTSQLGSIEQINHGLNSIREMNESSVANSARYREESARLTQQLAQLNSVYERMLSAMTVNMYQPPHGYQHGMPPQQPRMDNQHPY